LPSSSPNSSLEIGSAIGDYKITALCRAGSKATVYRAEHTRFLRQVAIKVIHNPVKASKAKEALNVLLGRINQVRHANVAELYDFGFLEGHHLYLVLEWIDGYALDSADPELLTRPVEERFSFLQSIASAIDEVHLSKLSLSGLDDAHVMVDSKRGRAKLIAYSLDAIFEVDGSDNAEELVKKVFSKAADYARLGALIQQLFLCDNSQLEDEVAENIEVIIARCRTSEDADQFGSGNAIVRALKIALGLEAPKDSKLAVGTLVGDSYKITGVIGKGGMGQVYEAVHVRLPQRVAIKVIDGTFTDESYIRFKQEAEIAASLGHPHLVRVFDFNTFEDGRPYMVMELLEGEDLGRSMRKGPLSPRRAVEIARQVGSALTAVHKKGVVHRDLKPPNVFLGKIAVGGREKEHATVLDFGVSKREDATISVTKTSAVVGTPQYMAPEQALGENDTLTAKADQFSLGCLLYEMLAGAPAFGRGTLAEVVYRVCQENPPPLKILFPDLPAGVSDAVQRAMSKTTSARFDSVADFVAALSEDELTDTALAPGPTVETMRGVAPADDSSTAATVANKKSDVVDPASDIAHATAPTEIGPGPASPKGGGRISRGIVLGSLAGLAALVFAIVWVTGGEKGSDKAPEGAHTIATDPSPEPKAVVVLAQVDAGVIAKGPTDAGAVEGAADPHDADIIVERESQDAGVVLVKARKLTPTRTPPSTKEPKEVKDKLDEAQRLVNAGRYREARRVVSRDKKASSTARGRSLVVKSYCGESNFGAAQDWLRRVPRSGKRAVIKYCKSKHEIELN
jgi:serine/threonine-protein kinase